MTQVRAQDHAGDHLISAEIELFQSLQRSRREASSSAQDIFNQFSENPLVQKLDTSINQMQTAGNELKSALEFLQRNAAFVARLSSQAPAKQKKEVADNFEKCKNEFQTCVKKFSNAATQSILLVIDIEKLNPKSLQESEDAIAEMAKKGKDQPLFEPLALLPGMTSGFSTEFKIEKKSDNDFYFSFTKT